MCIHTHTHTNAQMRKAPKCYNKFLTIGSALMAEMYEEKYLKIFIRTFKK